MRGRTHPPPIFAALALAHDDLASLEIEILHAQPKPFDDAHAGAVEQARNQPSLPVQRTEQRSDLGARENDRQPARAVRGDDFIEPGKVHLQYVLVQEEKRRLRLALCGGCDVTFGGEVTEECFGLRRAQRARMLQAVEPDESAHLIDVRLLGVVRVVAQSDLTADFVEKTRGGGVVGESIRGLLCRLSRRNSRLRAVGRRFIAPGQIVM